MAEETGEVSNLSIEQRKCLSVSSEPPWRISISIVVVSFK